jgi:hypothetical protein
MGTEEEWKKDKKFIREAHARLTHQKEEIQKGLPEWEQIKKVIQSVKEALKSIATEDNS